MTRGLSTKIIADACLKGLQRSEKIHAKWTGGLTMRAAPEWFVQTIVAEEIARLGPRLHLEESIGRILENAKVKHPKRLPRNERGRVDIAIYYKSGMPQMILEVKKIGKASSMDADKARTTAMMDLCKGIRHGLLLGYTTARRPATVEQRLAAVAVQTGAKIIRRLKLVQVTGKLGDDRVLGAAVYRVNRP